MTQPPAEARERKSPIAGWGAATWLASGLGVGLVPKAPGTFGALWGLALAYGIANIPAIGGLPAVVWQVGLIVAVALMGVPLSAAAARELGAKDPGVVVFDEISSVPITFFLVPAERFGEPAVLILGFALNRFMDVVKPPPARQLERLPGGWGIMADDWMAGVYSCLVLHAVLWSGVVHGAGGG
jgi:phosphatidylglycerophosphatase A